MNKFLEVVKARVQINSQNARLNEVFMKTVENIAFERVGKAAPHDDSEIFAELIALKSERKEKVNALSDEAALIATELFDEWDPDSAYETGDRFIYNGNLYRCKAPNPINSAWTPDVTHDYYEPIAKPSENGTFDNPITAVAGMEYEIGKYYSENGKIYLCVREGMSTGEKIKLHYLPSAVTGQYFEEVAT